MTDTLIELQRMTEELPELSELETAIGGPAVLFDEPHDIPHVGFGVYRDKDIAVMRNFARRGAVLETHIHPDEHEWIGVLKGKLEVKFTDDGSSVQISPMDTLHILPGRPHDVVAVEDTWAWSVSVPPANGYPSTNICPFALKSQIH